MGQGDCKDRENPQNVKNINEWCLLKKLKITKICAGEWHSYICCDDGLIYAFGNNNEIMLGLQEDLKTIFEPTVIEIKEINKNSFFFIDIDSQGFHSLALTSEGQVFSWGISSNGQLGHGNFDSLRFPKQIISLKNIKIMQVECGWNHSLCLSDQGIVFSFGKGSQGQLGLGNRLDYNVPFPINEFVNKNIKIKQISASYFYSCAIDSEGHVWTWGIGENGVLGHGNKEDQLTPKMISKWQCLNNQEPASISLISCSPFHVMCLTVNNDCFWWGQSSCLGFEKLKNVTVPNQIQSLIGLEFTFLSCSSDYSLVLCKSSNETNSHSESIKIIQKKKKKSIKHLEISYTLINSLKNPTSEYTIQNSRIKSEMENLKKNIDRKDSKFNDREDSQNSDNYLENSKNSDNHLDESLEKENLDFWINYAIPNWPISKKSPTTLKMWRKGLPDQLRGQIWPLAIGNKLMITFEDFTNSFIKSEVLNQQIKRKKLKSKQSPFNVIFVDVPRTLIETKLFVKNGKYYFDLIKLLSIYVGYDPEMSYVQGMSHLAALFVIYLELFPAFTCFTNLVHSHFFSSLFKMDVPQIVLHMRIYDILFEKNIPLLFRHFSQLEIVAEHYLLDWLMTSFSRSFSLPIVIRIFDCLIMEGELILFKVALSILKISQDSLLKSNFETCLLTIQKLSMSINEQILFNTIKLINVPKDVLMYLEKIEN